jgi:NAD(P)-dependent dehydrogenase (short-subunit alcohol dehydrogenase family)
MAVSSFQGKNVVVTGGGSGIGRALAHAFADEGANVSITDINQERIDQVVAEIATRGVESAGYVVDHSSEEETRLFADRLLADGGSVDIVCANAGIATGSLIESADMEDWRRVMDINVMGVAYTLRYLVPSMMARGSGKIVITASGAGLVPGPGMSVYHASKAAACSMGESLSIELEPHGISVSVLCPGIIKTAIATDSKLHFGDGDVDAEANKSSIEMYESSKAVEPSVVAQDVLRGLRKNKLIIPSPWSHVGPGWLLHRLAPGLFNRFLVLPKWRRGEMINGVKVLSR